MRILIFNDSMALGGTEKLLTNLLNHFASSDFDITLMLPNPTNSDVLLGELSQNIKINYLYKENTPRWQRKLGENLMIFCPRLFAKLKGIKSDDYDEVVCFKEGFYAKLFSKLPIRKILWIHNIVYHHRYEIRSVKERIAVWLNKKQLKTTRHSYQRYDKIICVSDACKKIYIDVLYQGKPPRQDIEVLYNAIDLTKVVEKSKAPITDLPTGVTKFILVTRSSPEKRTDRLINAASQLFEEGYSFHVYILGEGLDNEEMKKRLDQLRLSNTITLMGRVDNPYPYILQSDWLLCVSERESFSLVLLEAMALKTPVITTNCGGPCDIVAGGRYGVLVDNSTPGVYGGMKQVLDDCTLSVKYSGDLDQALLRFDYQIWLDRIDKILKQKG